MDPFVDDMENSDDEEMHLDEEQTPELINSGRLGLVGDEEEPSLEEDEDDNIEEGEEDDTDEGEEVEIYDQTDDEGEAEQCT